MVGISSASREFGGFSWVLGPLGFLPVGMEKGGKHGRVASQILALKQTLRCPLLPSSPPPQASATPRSSVAVQLNLFWPAGNPGTPESDWAAREEGKKRKK